MKFGILTSIYSKSYLAILISLVILSSEVLLYYFVLLQCDWPSLTNNGKDVLHAMVLADPHLLGPYRGHWFDKLRREWQMSQAFWASLTLHKPDLVLVLGDLFDEGQWCDRAQFKAYANRFKEVFSVPVDTDLLVVPGNHDLGFHYRITSQRERWFRNLFNLNASVSLVTRKDVHMVLINSMALHGDGCSLCTQAQKALQEIVQHLACSKMSSLNCTHPLKYSRPIVFQHFPLYRESDSHCNQPDPDPKPVHFREGWECLSKESSNLILNHLHPRAVFSGHTHYGCITHHQYNITEWTVASFSWRNNLQPSFLLVSLSPEDVAVSRCGLPLESTIILLYCAGTGLTFLAFIILHILRKQAEKLVKKVRNKFQNFADFLNAF